MADPPAQPLYPPHAYVPGQNARHPEDWFDSIKQSATPAMDPAALAQSAAYRMGAAYLKKGFFWECHEVLEAVWMALPDGPDRRFVQAVIQLANARLKLRMGKPGATLRLCDIAESHLRQTAGAVPVPGLSVEDLHACLTDTRLSADAQ